MLFRTFVKDDHKDPNFGKLSHRLGMLLITLRMLNPAWSHPVFRISTPLKDMILCRRCCQASLDIKFTWKALSAFFLFYFFIINVFFNKHFVNQARGVYEGPV